MKILQNIKELLELELEEIYLLSPIFIGIGIVIFFHLPSDPSLLSCFLPFLIAALFAYLCRNNLILMRSSIALCIIALGFLACEFRVLSIDSPRIKEQLEYVEVTGTIAQIIDTPDARKFLLDTLEIEDLEKQNTPKYVRIALKSDISGFTIGDRVQFKATLMPPPYPSFIGGFNFAEYTYFKEIGAIGYATSRPRLISSNNLSNISKHINAFRNQIGKRIESRIDATSASIALALLIGDTSKIPAQELSMIRISGIAHIIAISGLHVVIIVGLIFFSFRFLLARIPYMANHYDLKKIAAAIGILGSFFYLIIAGAPISAQRAFIMSSLTLFAIIIDRKSNPMRSVATAAIIILLFTPENLFTPSLQMSFAACISLIAGYAATANLLKAYTSKFGGYVLGIVISTLLAGSATTPFVIYHFNQFSTYSLITNLFAIPLTNFIIMPFGVASLLLMPINLDWITLHPMAWAIDVMVWVATKVSILPEASLRIASYSAGGISLIALGGAMLCMMTTQLRLLGIPLIIIGSLTNIQIFKSPTPDLMFDSRGKLFAIKIDDKYYFSNKVSARFVRKTWEQTFDIQTASTIKSLENCSKESCAFEKDGKRILILMSGSPKSCEFDFIANLTGFKTDCEEKLNLQSLKDQGNTFVWLKENNIKIRTVTQSLKKRIWNGLME
ncbi:MAG: ComEC/Rec2 family protein [Candidatus Midichloriaceae bacterium]|jgi:competence protein ComEC|nr:ComEC/Rec2 family protein [Candidatus Midichloriaceae bacterium]